MKAKHPYLVCLFTFITYSQLFVYLFLNILSFIFLGLSFGRFADFSLMKTLSLQNYAFTRKIYIAADAALQLEGFYKEVNQDSI